MLAILSGRRRRIVAVGATALTAVIGGGGVAYATMNKSVKLTVDGQTRQVSAFAGTVGELLDDQGLKTGDKDIVAPAKNSDLGDGDTVVVRYARPLTLTVDGQKRVHWTTETSVDKALAAIGVRFDNAVLSASRSARIARSGLAMSLSTPKQVSLTVSGRARPVTTTAQTVADLLREQRLAARPQDRLSSPATTPLRAGMAITLVRIDTKRVTATEPVKHGVTRQQSAALYKGDTEVVTEGRNGSRRAVYDLTLTDGRESGRKLVSAAVTAQPVTEVVQVGTKKKPAPKPSSSDGGGGGGGGGDVGGSADGLNWGALAQCESGGDSDIVSSNGMYHGLYQFSVSTWKSVGGSGLPSNASSSEQTKRAKMLYNKAGAGQWPVCGKKLFT